MSCRANEKVQSLKFYKLWPRAIRRCRAPAIDGGTLSVRRDSLVVVQRYELLELLLRKSASAGMSSKTRAL